MLTSAFARSPPPPLLCTTGVCVVFADGILWYGREDGLRFVGAATNVEVRTCAVAPATNRVARSTSPNIAHLKSHIAQNRTLLHKLRKKYCQKPKIWAFNAFLLTNFIAQRFKISPKFPIWAMKSPIWPPWPQRAPDPTMSQCHSSFFEWPVPKM